MLHRFMVLLACLALGACQAYDVTVNERLVYTPRPLLTDFQVADPALQECLRRAIARYRVSRAPELRELACPDAGITTLAGLGQFTGLQVLDLEDNQLSDIAELRQVLALEELYLAGNPIVDPLPLADLQALHTVDLGNNRALRCPDRQALLRVSSLHLPAHCR